MTTTHRIQPYPFSYITNNIAHQQQMATVSCTEISQRAYQIWESENYPDGQHLRHWYQALADLGVSEFEQPQNPIHRQFKSFFVSLSTDEQKDLRCRLVAYFDANARCERSVLAQTLCDHVVEFPGMPIIDENDVNLLEYFHELCLAEKDTTCTTTTDPRLDCCISVDTEHNKHKTPDSSDSDGTDDGAATDSTDNTDSSTSTCK